MNFDIYKDVSDPDTVSAFQEAVFTLLGIESNEQSIDVFSKAWDYGHEGGFEEVFWQFVDLIEAYGIKQYGAPTPYLN